MDGGAWRRRTAARGLCVSLNNAGVASKPEDVVDFTRRSESKASEWLLSKPGTREGERKATGRSNAESRKRPGPSNIGARAATIEEPGAGGLATRRH